MTSPLCFLPNGQLLCDDTGSFVLMRDCDIIRHISSSSSITKQLIEKSRWLTRLLRIGIRASLAIDNEHVVLSYGHCLRELDLQTGMVSSGWSLNKRVRPLSFTCVKDITGFSDGVYFGEYFHNKEKTPVSIYHRVGVDQWEIVYTFPEGTINHVHSIIPDAIRQCLWVFTGDFGDSAAIWRVSDGFNKVERFVYGDQKWRGCVAFAIPEGVLYATDTPFSSNHIYLLRDDKSVEIIADLCGSCIYGCRWNNDFVFSSTVEPDGRDESLKRLLFNKSKGSGIADDCVRMYIGNIYKGFKVVYKEKKDYLPFIFQFGVFRFPSGDNNGNTLFFQPVATCDNDQRMITMKF